jgi:hypothetical protein
VDKAVRAQIAVEASRVQIPVGSSVSVGKFPGTQRLGWGVHLGADKRRHRKRRKEIIPISMCGISRNAS